MDRRQLRKLAKQSASFGFLLPYPLLLFYSAGAEALVHDTSLLGRLHGDTLNPDEFWLAEKNVSGVSALYSVAEFSVRDRDNLGRRYMQGRYGAVPMISWQTLRGQLAEHDAS